jgi:hypothetical protein
MAEGAMAEEVDTTTEGDTEVGEGLEMVVDSVALTLFDESRVSNRQSSFVIIVQLC